MPRYLSRFATACAAFAMTCAVHGAWISDLAVTDTRGPAISA